MSCLAPDSPRPVATNDRIIVLLADAVLRVTVAGGMEEDTGFSCFRYIQACDDDGHGRCWVVERGEGSSSHATCRCCEEQQQDGLTLLAPAASRSLNH
uniref:Uncharacterized protein n=1 Tax=Oryza glumipatula TaxID=40148 RepID=A0A0D9Z9W8_9ORYZ